MLDLEALAFVDAAAALPPAALAQTVDRSVALRRSGGRDASLATKLSAAEDSELDHLIRETLRPRSDELTAFRGGLHSDARSAVTLAARAVQKRGRLGDEQYEVLMAPFVDVGVAAPDRTASAPEHEHSPNTEGRQR